MALAGLLLGALALSTRTLEEEGTPAWRKLQAKMVIEFCSKHLGSELLPCKEQLALQSLKGMTKDERQKIIQDTVAKIEEKRKKKVALAMHDDQKLMYDEFCATKKETSEICSNEELKNFLATPLDLSNFKGRGFTDLYS
ncbi:MAG: hypothetical protein SGPRY_000624 [Prymnesium sp.]